MRSERGSVEFGTIVLALVGVMAAGAGASFVVDSALELGEKGSAKASDAVENQGVALKVLEARTEAGAAGLTKLHELVAVEGAGGRIELATLVLQLSAGGRTFSFPYSVSGEPGTFAVTSVRDVDGSLQAPQVVLGDGDLADLSIHLGPAGLHLQEAGAYTQQQAAPGLRTTEAQMDLSTDALDTSVRIG